MYLAALFVAVMLSLGGQVAEHPTGRWERSLQVPQREISITLDLARTPAGAWIGSVGIPASTSIDVPLGNFTIEGSVVRFTATLPGRAAFEALLRTGARRLSGTVPNPEGSAR
jgi:hypothetical protein